MNRIKQWWLSGFTTGHLLLIAGVCLLVCLNPFRCSRSVHVDRNDTDNKGTAK